MIEVLHSIVLSIKFLVFVGSMMAWLLAAYGLMTARSVPLYLRPLGFLMVVFALVSTTTVWFNDYLAWVTSW